MRNEMGRKQMEIMKSRRQTLILRGATFRAGAKGGIEWHNHADQDEHRRISEDLQYYYANMGWLDGFGRETAWMAHAMLAFSIYLFMAYRPVVSHFFR
ncbi:hypothetical protein QU487_23945 [Crenobacter sp. SG2305]|uniref:hypothetical protein n=1 Tax=Crenobacter oryzisoli TaxID=3056844 RepID=UPI0025AA59CB|nr:hypothetical protein [Crenobacter sp. SG2305]MDN0085741.1 hypothetical protein [Crenobacter sp. SG2305]